MSFTRFSFFSSFFERFNDNFLSCWLELVRVGSWDEFESQLKKENEHKPCLMPEWLLLLFLFICMLQISFLTDNERLLNERKGPFAVWRWCHLLFYEYWSPRNKLRRFIFSRRFLETYKLNNRKLTDIRQTATNFSSPPFNSQENSSTHIKKSFSFNFQPQKKKCFLILRDKKMKNKPNLDLYPFNKKVFLDLLRTRETCQERNWKKKYLNRN